MKATSSMSAPASEIGLPASRDSIAASRSRSRRTMSAARSRMRPRSRAGVPGHHVPSSKVRLAASTARSTSAGWESGAVAITSPVDGSNTSNRAPSIESTHFPSMKFCSASAIGHRLPRDLVGPPDRTPGVGGKPTARGYRLGRVPGTLGRCARCDRRCYSWLRRQPAARRLPRTPTSHCTRRRARRSPGPSAMSSCRWRGSRRGSIRPARGAISQVPGRAPSSR